MIGITNTPITKELMNVSDLAQMSCVFIGKPRPQLLLKGSYNERLEIDITGNALL